MSIERYNNIKRWTIKLMLTGRVRWFFVFGSIGGIFLGGCNVNVGNQQRSLIKQDRIQGELELVAERHTDEQGTSNNKRKSR